MSRSLDLKEVAAELEKWLGREPSDEEIQAEIETRHEVFEAMHEAAANRGDYGPIYKEIFRGQA